LPTLAQTSTLSVWKFLAKSRPVRAGLLALIVFGILFIPPASHARVYVRIDPPAVIVENAPATTWTHLCLDPWALAMEKYAPGFNYSSFDRKSGC
jgi:hypothetical protein